jgi:hypothetical protein
MQWRLFILEILSLTSAVRLVTGLWREWSNCDDQEHRRDQFESYTSKWHRAPWYRVLVLLNTFI